LDTHEMLTSTNSSNFMNSFILASRCSGKDFFCLATVHTAR